MFVEIDGARLFVDVEGAGLVVDGDAMRTKPTLVLLHGGPGFDHSGFKPYFSRFTDVAQVVYYDHRGNGRSSGDDPSAWNLAQWGDDVKTLCERLGIAKPIVLGLSFGGFVAQAYATRHPDHPAKLILMSTAARVDFETIFTTFARLGGPAVAAVARAYWTHPTTEGRAEYLRECVPYYRRVPGGLEAFRRAIMRTETALHFNGPQNEHGRFDFRADLARIACPVLVMAGGHDPITPIPFSEEIVASLPADCVRFERFPEAAHGVHGDDPERAYRLIRDFICEA